MAVRSLICTVVGHVDHGKSSLLDKIRGTSIVKGEAGRITQAIGASIIPLETIKKICGDLFKKLESGVKIPSLLFIDTPGHAAFHNLRKRGGSLADIAILVVDINEGFKPQTIESIEILKNHKTPFVIAANKLDLIPGWKSFSDKNLRASFEEQRPDVIKKFESHIYGIVGSAYENGFESDRFDRVDDFTKKIAIIPCSAETGEGIPELLAVITGLAQKFLESRLQVDTEGNARGTILEIREDKGVGKSIDLILYEGRLKVNDIIIIGGIDKPIISKVKVLLEPEPLGEMRDRKARFKSITEVHAATGIKIVAPGIDDAAAGMPLISVKSEQDIPKAVDEVESMVGEVTLDVDSEGILVKADTLGSLEALRVILKDEDIRIKRLGIGDINKKDIMEAVSLKESDISFGAIIGFNVNMNKDVELLAKDKEIKIITSDVIYTLVDTFKEWKESLEKKKEEEEFRSLQKPFEIDSLEGYIFRQKDPAVFGVEVAEGAVAAGASVIDSKGNRLGIIKGMQAEKKNIKEAKKGDKFAVSIDKIVVGRNFHEGEKLFSDIDESDFKRLKIFKKKLSEEDKELLKKIAEIKRKINPVWGLGR